MGLINFFITVCFSALHFVWFNRPTEKHFSRYNEKNKTVTTYVKKKVTQLLIISS